MTLNKIIFQVDSFADEPFKGNPAGVMILSEEPSSEWMQSIAAEMNLSETAFIVPQKNDFLIRFFTPTNEVPLCGHATLASSHIIYELGLKSPNETIVFKAQQDILTIRKEDEWIVMDFPVFPIHKIEIPDEFQGLIGFKPMEMYASLHDWKIAVAENESDVINSNPKFSSLNEHGLGQLMVTAKSNLSDVDFVVRCFCPIDGIDEDPVTGSAHCALTPLWAEKLGKETFNSIQMSKRTGRLKVKLNGDRVEIKGKAITIFEAKLNI